jgi:hypothetical protein
VQIIWASVRRLHSRTTINSKIAHGAGGQKVLRRKRHDRASSHRHPFIEFLYFQIEKMSRFFDGKNQMKKPKRSGRNVNAKRGAKRNDRHAKRDRLAETVGRMAAEGLVEDQIALRLGLDKNDLRARFIDDIKRGKSVAAASEADASELSLEEYHFCDVLWDSFHSHWQDPICGNLLFAGTDGKSARTIADAFAAWKKRGGRYNCTGRSTRFAKDKAIEFAKIVSQWKTETGKSEP